MTDHEPPLTGEEIRKVREIIPVVTVFTQNVTAAQQMLGRQDRFGQEISELRREMSADRAETAKRQTELSQVHSLIEDQKSQAERDRQNFDNRLAEVKKSVDTLIAKVESLLEDPAAFKLSDLKKIMMNVVVAAMVAAVLGYMALSGFVMK